MGGTQIRIADKDGYRYGYGYGYGHCLWDCIWVAGLLAFAWFCINSGTSNMGHYTDINIDAIAQPKNPFLGQHHARS